jgi:hypothetical protein
MEKSAIKEKSLLPRYIKQQIPSSKTSIDKLFSKG